MSNDDGPAPETSALLAELTELAKHSVEVRKRTRDFLDHLGVIASLEVNNAATRVAGHPVYSEKPTEGLLSHLVAMRALYAEEKALGAGKSHDVSPSCVANYANAEIEITPEMIGVGLAVFEATYLGAGEYAFSDQIIARAYRAMRVIEPKQAP